MKSKIIKKDRHDLTKLAQELSPKDRLLAFLNHNQLLAKLSKYENNRSRPIRTASR